MRTARRYIVPTRFGCCRASRLSPDGIAQCELDGRRDSDSRYCQFEFTMLPRTVTANRQAFFERSLKEERKYRLAIRGIFMLVGIVSTR